MASATCRGCYGHCTCAGLAHQRQRSVCTGGRRAPWPGNKLGQTNTDMLLVKTTCLDEIRLGIIQTPPGLKPGRGEGFWERFRERPGLSRQRRWFINPWALQIRYHLNNGSRREISTPLGGLHCSSRNISGVIWPANQDQSSYYRIDFNYSNSNLHNGNFPKLEVVIYQLYIESREHHTSCQIWKGISSLGVNPP